MEARRIHYKGAVGLMKKLILAMLFCAILYAPITAYAADEPATAEPHTFTGQIVGRAELVSENGNVIDGIILIDETGTTHIIDHFYLEAGDMADFATATTYWQYDTYGELDNMQIVSIDRNGNETLLADF